MSESTYRDDLAAAQMRSQALESELAAAQRQIGKLTEKKSDKLRGLITAGLVEDQRKLQNAQRIKAREKLSAERWKQRKRYWQQWAIGRRRRRTMSAVPLLSRWLMPLIIMGVLLPFAPIFILFETPRLLLGYLAMTLATIYAVSLPWGWLAMYRERNRIDALPFEVSGHIESLGTDITAPKLYIQFRGEKPSIQATQALMLGLAKRSHSLFAKIALRSTHVDTVGNQLRFHSDEVSTSWISDNRVYLLWYRKLVEAGALALHDSYPIESIRIA